MVRNYQSVFSNIGASNHSKYEREANDYYSTDPLAIRLLHNHGLLDKNMDYWETACGNGVLCEELKNLNYNVVKATDLFDRGYGGGRYGIDFLEQEELFIGNTITNPPYSLINDWIKHSLKVTSNKVYIFCRIQTIETLKRYEIFKDNPPLYICPFVKRIKCYKNGETKSHGSAVCYSWFIWDNQIDNVETKVKWLI